MRILPILFNTEMVRRLQDDMKTVTRRVVKVRFRDGEAGWNIITKAHTGEFCYLEVYDEWEEEVRRLGAPYEPGDILYVRETWAQGVIDSTDFEGICNESFFEPYTPPTAFGKYFDERIRYFYRADFSYEEEHEVHMVWRPSIHMPKEAARIFLKVKAVRVERLQDSFFAPISPIFELLAEGMDIGDDCRNCIATYGNPCCVDTVDEDGSNLYGGDCGILDEVRGEFSELWDSTIKPADRDKYGWAANPWVWVIEFEQTDKPEGWPSFEEVVPR